MSDPVEALDRAFSRGLDEGLHKLRDFAVERSSGPYSSSILALMGHPYAVLRWGSAQLPAGRINVQDKGPDGFRASWIVPPVQGFGGDVNGSLENHSPVADFLTHGTKFMFMRPIDKEVEAAGEAIIEAAIYEELALFERQDFVIR